MTKAPDKAFPSPEQVSKQLQGALAGSDDLRQKQYRGNSNPLTGHCYIASEAAYHALGGKAQGWKPMQMSVAGTPHWWLEGPEHKVLDITEGQFPQGVEHEKGRGKGFLTRDPSKRAQTLMNRAGLRP